MLSVVTSAEAEEVVVEWLTQTFGQPPSVFADEKTQRTTVSLYLRQKPVWTEGRRREIAGSWKQLSRCGLQIGTEPPTLSRLKNEDWAESWKRHFPVIEIGRTLLVQPGWIKRKAKPGQAVVTLNPGLSFGTGQHPTTAFCLRQIAQLREAGAHGSLLDLGTGSGILAIAAAKLGYTPIHAVDNDPEAVRIAQANARRNRAEQKIAFRHFDLMKMAVRSKVRYQVVCANLTADLLISERSRILGSLKPNGSLIVAGILREQFDSVKQAYERAGLRLIEALTDGEWRSGRFKAL